MLGTFSSPGRFYKGNLHTHSTNSDGVLPPAEVCRRYRERGYDFLCLSDHFLAEYDFPLSNTRVFRAPGFTTLIGAELHAPATHRGELWHILAVGLPLDFARTGPQETGPALARRAREAGAFVGVAHPQWYGLDLSDGRALDAAHAVEIYNHGCEMLSARPDGVILWDDLLSDGAARTGFASDDAHFECADAFGGWVQVKAESLDPEALVDALKRGDFYASTGPDILAVEQDGAALVVATTPARSIVLVGQQAEAIARHGDGLTRATLSFDAFAGTWCRLVVTDAAGKRAWSQPLTIADEPEAGAVIAS